MNIDQLKAFYKVAQTGSFTKAGRTLFITQSAVSQQVQALEHSLGITLFDRSGKKVLLTGEGEILLSHAKRLFDLYEEIVTLFGLQQTLRKGKISIASTRVVGTYYLPQVIGLFNKQYPGIEIDLRLGNSHRIIEIILEGEVDFGFAGKVKRHSRLTDIPVHQERLLIVASPDHYLVSKKHIIVDELIKTPFIWREKGTQTQAVVKKWFEKNIGRNYPKKSIELENVEAAKRIVEAGFGITIIPEAAVKREISTGLLKSIKLKGFDHSVNFHLFHLKGKVFSKAAETFLKMLAGIRLLSLSGNLEDSLKP
jgi:DNA-binding transcriptional LysR family regulator